MDNLIILSSCKSKNTYWTNSMFVIPNE